MQTLLTLRQFFLRRKSELNIQDGSENEKSTTLTTISPTYFTR